jgi:hypothetical protein
MSTIVWGWAAAWLIGRLWLEWRVERSWLPGTAEVREYYTDWAVHPRTR